MGIAFEYQPMLGLGFAIHFDEPLLELVLGCFIIRIGDSATIARLYEIDIEDDRD